MKRRTFLKNSAFAATFTALPQTVSYNSGKGDKKNERLVYIGTYTKAGSEGIYICRFNDSSGRLSVQGVKKNVTDPSFLAADPRKKFLYAVNEVNKIEGNQGGGVSSFSIDKDSGELHFLNQQNSGGAHPCNLTVSNDGKFVLAGNYSGGSFSVLPVLPDGSLLPPIQVVQHKGSGIIAKRQDAPHVHCLMFNKSNTHLIVTDLGTDKIIIYPFDKSVGKVLESDAHYVSTQPGAGPRHLAFSPDEKFVYAINELNSTITVYQYGKSQGVLTEVQTVSTLPEKFEGVNSCADIHVHPSGKYLYGSNRGHDSIAVYSRDIKSGKLNLIELTSTGGKNPRNFSLDPEGNFLLAANQGSNNIVSFRINPDTGKLISCDEIIEIPAPVCIKFL